MSHIYMFWLKVVSDTCRNENGAMTLGQLSKLAWKIHLRAKETLCTFGTRL